MARPSKSAVQPLRPAPERGPDVIVDFFLDEGLLFASVENVGVGPAERVSVELDRAFRGATGQDMRGIGLFRGIGFLAAGRRIATFVDAASAYFARGEPTRLASVIRFEDREGRAYISRVTHDLGTYADLGWVHRPGGDHTAREQEAKHDGDRS